MKIFAVVIVSTAPPFEEEGSILTMCKNFPLKYITHRKVLSDTSKFLGRQMAIHCQSSSRLSSESEDKQICVEKAQSQVASVVITSLDYPKRLAFSLGRRSMEAFTGRYPDIQSFPKDPMVKFEAINRLVKEYENPKDFDKLSQVIGATEDAMNVVHESLQNMLIRGQKLEELVVKSQDLDEKSKMFYKESQKRCCLIF